MFPETASSTENFNLSEKTYVNPPNVISQVAARSVANDCKKEPARINNVYEDGNKKLGYQGTEGSFSSKACNEVYPDLKKFPFKDVESALNALTEGRVDLAMIPIDNSIAGRVPDLHRLFPRYKDRISIIGEYFLLIQHCLMAIKGATLDDIKIVQSHIMALLQCTNFLNEFGWRREEAFDTAGAAKQVSEGGDKIYAAIAPKLAAEIYGLDILVENIQDDSNNTTRFLILSRDICHTPFEYNTPFITSLIFKVNKTPAALCNSLGGFAKNGVHVPKLESYIDPNFTSTQFFADVEGHPEEESLKLAFEELEKFSEYITFLGTYKAHPYRKNILEIDSK